MTPASNKSVLIERVQIGAPMALADKAFRVLRTLQTIDGGKQVAVDQFWPALR
jgi:hypothetical protein